MKIEEIKQAIEVMNRLIIESAIDTGSEYSNKRDKCLNTALQALHNELERAEGCEHCKCCVNCAYSLCIHSQGICNFCNDKSGFVPRNYCCECGKKLIEEE